MSLAFALPMTEPTKQPRVLLVDDDRTMTVSMESMLEDLGYRVETAGNGAEAFALLREDPQRADIVMTDRTMPVMDGLALTRRLKRESATRDIPIVMLTGAKESADIGAGLEAGAFYYLVKPADKNLVASVLGSAMQEVERQFRIRREVGSHQAAFANIQSIRFRLSKPSEVEPVVSMLASMHADPERAIQGLFELVQNGVEHGVLGFGFDAKLSLVKAGGWEQALNIRARDKAYAEGWVEASAIRKDGGIVYAVRDSGPGFNWRRYLKSDPSRASSETGRGITRAVNFCFDKVNFNQAGNAVAAFLAQEKKVKW